MTERCVLKCHLCDKNALSKYDLIQHIYQHLSYRKYQCASCTERFYSEEERDLHCIEAGHFHIHGIKLTPYCEFYVNQLLKDAEYAVRHGMETVVEQRIKASLACDVAMNKLSSCAGDTESPIEISSPKQETKSSSAKKAKEKKSKAANDVERNRDASCGNDQPPSRVESSKETAPSVNKTKTTKTDDNQSEKASAVTDGVRSPSITKEHFPWHRLPQKLKIRILQNLPRSDLKKCQLVNREMLELIRLRMKRRSIWHLVVEMISGCAFQWSAVYLEEGLCKSLVKELKTVKMVSSNLPQLFNNADIDRLEFLEVPLSDNILSSILSCLLNAGCRVHEVGFLGTSMASVTSSTLLRFLRELSVTGSLFGSISDCSPDTLIPEVLQFIVTRELVLIKNFRGCVIPIYDDILAKLTADRFFIDAPNMITMKGLKSFVQRLASGKQKVTAGRIYTNFPLKGISFPKIPNVVLKVSTGENCVAFLANEAKLEDQCFAFFGMSNTHSPLFRSLPL